MASTKFVTVTPAAASADGCIALCQAYIEHEQETISHTDTQEKGYRYFTNYYLWAKGTSRWRFKQFTFQWENTDLNRDGTTSSQQSSTSSSRNPYPSSLSIEYPVRPSDYVSSIPSGHSQAMYSGTFWDVVAEFEYVGEDPSDKYFIKTAADPAGGGSTFGDNWLYPGDTCRLLAVPNPGYEFSHWSNGSTNPEISFTVTGNATYTAYFTGDESSSEESSEDSSEEPPGPDSSEESSEEWEDGPLLYNPKTGHLRYNTLTNHLRYKHRQIS